MDTKSNMSKSKQTILDTPESKSSKIKPSSELKDKKETKSPNESNISSLNISKLQSQASVENNQFDKQFEENKTQGLPKPGKDFKSSLAAETPMTVNSDSPADQLKEHKEIKEEQKDWNFAFDSNSDSMESFDSDQMFMQQPILSQPFNMFSEPVTATSHLIIAPPIHHEGALLSSPMSQPPAQQSFSPRHQNHLSAL